MKIFLTICLLCGMVLRADTSQQKLQERAANADFVLVVEVKHVGASPGFWSGLLAASQQVTFKVIKVLKGTLNEAEVQVEYYLVKNDELVDVEKPRLSPELFKAGNKLIVFLKANQKSSETNFPASQHKGTVRADPDKLKFLSPH
jgi:hypothetical protein